jgi:hypothetical protein
MTPATLLTFPRPIDKHPHAHLIPTSHHGFDREGRPIYWEVYYAILYYTILYTIHYTLLYYTILYYTILYYTILYYTILYYTIHYTLLYYTILYYTILHYTLLYYTILYYTILYYTILYMMYIHSSIHFPCMNVWWPHGMSDVCMYVCVCVSLYLENWSYSSYHVTSEGTLLQYWGKLQLM